MDIYTQITDCHHDVGQLSFIRLHGQDSQKQRTHGVTKISQNENSPILTNIKVVSWVKNTNTINFPELGPASNYTYVPLLALFFMA